jgi:hypothetical protein
MRVLSKGPFAQPREHNVRQCLSCTESRPKEMMVELSYSKPHFC